MSEGWFSGRAIPVGAISYIDIDGYRYRRDVVFCYDLRLPENFEPKNEGMYSNTSYPCFFFIEIDSVVKFQTRNVIILKRWLDILGRINIDLSL